MCCARMSSEFGIEDLTEKPHRYPPSGLEYLHLPVLTPVEVAAKCMENRRAFTVNILLCPYRIIDRTLYAFPPPGA